eukprot:scaffold626_cov409-Prasinococcus_capsulatus_cf.AAC.2
MAWMAAAALGGVGLIGTPDDIGKLPGPDTPGAGRITWLAYPCIPTGGAYPPGCGTVGIGRTLPAAIPACPYAPEGAGATG